MDKYQIHCIQQQFLDWRKLCDHCVASKHFKLTIAAIRDFTDSNETIVSLRLGGS